MTNLISVNFPFLQATLLDNATESAIEDLLREGESVNTMNSYRSALKYWAAWHFNRYGFQIQLPLNIVCVLQFIVDHAERSSVLGLVSELPLTIDQTMVDAGQKGKLGPIAYSTLLHRISVLSKAHQLRQLANPCRDPKVKELLSRTRKAYARRGVLPLQKDALTKDVFKEILNTCDETLKGIRDRALLLFAWTSGGRRRSEVANADMKFLKLVPDGYTYTLLYSKTNQAGLHRPENEKPLIGAAGTALKNWLEVSAIVEGPIFRQVRKGGYVGGVLAAASVRDIVKHRCLLAGIKGDFSAHSIRSGFVTEAGRQNVPLPEIMAMTGHCSVSSVIGYTRAGTLMTSNVAKLFDSNPI